jgi:L-aminopeptidase/D-esterase-like protein
MQIQNSITDVDQIQIGHAQDLEALTGCTVVLCPRGAVAGISQRGGAPGTRETDLLRPNHLVEKVHAILLSGGSAFGLDAAGGVMRYLEDKKVGYKTGTAIVPIVPAAILYDLAIGNPSIRPDAAMGYDACQNATAEKPAMGNVGAGTGATVGKIFGMQRAMKSGIGTSSRDIGGGVIIGAIAAVNAFGDVLDYHDRKIIVGARKTMEQKISKSGIQFANTLEVLGSMAGRGMMNFASKQNTIIGVIATNARLNKSAASKFAENASDGISLTVQPAFSMFDGDTVFGLSTGSKKIDLNILCAFASLVFADAILNAVRTSKSAGGLPAASGM